MDEAETKGHSEKELQMLQWKAMMVNDTEREILSVLKVFKSVVHPIPCQVEYMSNNVIDNFMYSGWNVIY